MCFGQSVLYALGGYAASWGLYSRFIKLGVYTYSRHKAFIANNLNVSSATFKVEISG